MIPDLAFTQGDKNYVLSNGDVYLVHPDGTREFQERFYDPDFYLKNYQHQIQIVQVDPESGATYPVLLAFADAFESSAKLISPSRWHANNTESARAGQADNYYHLGNRVELTSIRQRSGSYSLRCTAKPSATQVSKASLTRNLMYFKQGDHVYTSMWLFLKPTPSVYDGGGTTFMDLESSFMQSVGLRLIVRQSAAGQDALAFELEFPKTQFKQAPGSEVPFPTGRWVQVRTHALLSADDTGMVQIWQDGREVLNATGRTLPLADTIYDRIEIGVTALAQGALYEKVLWIDEFEISHAPLWRLA